MPITFSDAVKTCLQKYVTLSGRASRAEFWWFYLFTVLVRIATSILDKILFPSLGFEETGPINGITYLALLVPTITVTVRRLHDTGCPGYYIFAPLLFIAAAVTMGAFIGPMLEGLGMILIFLVAIFGIGLMFYWLVKASDPGPNKYGPNPYDPLNETNLTEVFE